MQENRLPDPRDELCDKYKGKYGDDERHGGYRERGGMQVTQI